MTKLKYALEENKQLRILDAERTTQITSQAAQIVVQAARIAYLELLVEKLTFQFAALKRMQYGQKSEASNALQAELFGAQSIEVEALADAVIKPVLSKTSAQPKAAPRITIPKDLPVEEITIDIEIYLRDGKVNLAKQTLCDWVLVSSSWLAPLAEAIKMSILQESVIHVDETVLPLLHPVKTINARAWAYVGAASKLVYYEFTTNKKGEHVRNVLEQWNPPDGKRYLQADAASNYDALYRCQPVLVCACREQAN